MLWGASWCRKDVRGDSTSLAGVTLDRLKQTYARYYLPNNSALIVTGDVSSDRVFEQARDAFRDWRCGAGPFLGHPVPPNPQPSTNTARVVAADARDHTRRVALQRPVGGTDPRGTYPAH